MSAAQVLQHLYSLDPSSPDFLRALYGLIRLDKDEQYSSSLQGPELARLVDFLDKALCVIPTTDDVFRQCLRKIQVICSCHTTLPSSHILSGDLARVSAHPTAWGGFADVYEGTLGDRNVCIKVLRVSLSDDQTLAETFFREAVVWKRLRHPNVVPFLGVTINPFQFVSEWIPNGILTNYVKKNPGVNRIGLLLDVAEGLNYLHTSHTIHGDLKGPNILVDHSGHARLTDFGLASIVRGINSVLTTQAEACTPRWTAPEILEGTGKRTREADLFSFGMVVTEVFTGSPPFCDLSSTSVTVKIMDGKRPVRPSEAQEIGLVDPVWAMTVNCWEQNPSHRPTMAAVVRFLRECYALRAANGSLSALAPWDQTGNVDGGTNHTLIPPMLTGGQQTPIQSSGISQHSNHPNFWTHEASSNPNSYSSRGSSREPLYDEPRALSNLALFAEGGFDASIPNVGIRNQKLRPENNQISPGTPSPKGTSGRGTPLRGATADDKINPLQSMRAKFRSSSLPARKDSGPPQSIGPDSDHGAGIGVPTQQSGKGGKRPPKTAKGLWKMIATAIKFTAVAKPAPAGDHAG